MTSRLRSVLVILGLTALSGCGDFHAGPISYREHERFSTDLKDKPNARSAITKSLTTLFGESPQKMKVPANSGLPEGGAYLASSVVTNEDEIVPIAYIDPTTSGKTPIEGGYALYRKHCLHCHGVSGAGDGPTANFLFPRPRDYRRGVYKFTSTNPTNAKPTREDLAKTLRYGLHGTSMPAFEALMTEGEIQQVVDYVIFLSMRGELEHRLIEEASQIEDSDTAESLNDETVNDILQGVITSWKAAEGQVVNPTVKRVPPTRESILRGRDLFLGINTTGNKLACVDCHGTKAAGDGMSFVEKPIFDKVVFGLEPLDVAIRKRFDEIEWETASRLGGHGSAEHGDDSQHSAAPTGDFEKYKALITDTWTKGSLDDWGNPLRPANLNLGVYKGGRRPIDLYWRIAKGINYAKMPAHSSLISDAQIWDVVNFVLALPYDRELLRDADQLRARAAAQPAKVASAASE
ncbi:MAG: c-type cytochrome [Isosphaeraceae bacterium]|nr:c-type cytochrome [Isosphaeraceae bacterium]